MRTSSFLSVCAVAGTLLIGCSSSDGGSTASDAGAQANDAASSADASQNDDSSAATSGKSCTITLDGVGYPAAESIYASATYSAVSKTVAVVCVIVGTGSPNTYFSAAYDNVRGTGVWTGDSFGDATALAEGNDTDPPTVNYEISNLQVAFNHVSETLVQGNTSFTATAGAVTHQVSITYSFPHN